jgi:hypothetical protein
MMERLLDTLRTLEVALHQPAVRSDRGRLDALLHPAFREFGRSGVMYTRAEILAEFATAQQRYTVWSQDFVAESISDDLVLLTYRSAHANGAGVLDRHAIRASLWQRTERGWQMRFHQGTATQGFEKSESETE